MSTQEQPAASRAIAQEAGRAALYDLFAQAPAPICVFRGTELICDMANEACLRMLGRDDITGKRLLDTLPELAAQGFDELLRAAMQSGSVQVRHEEPVRCSRREEGREDAFFTFVCAPLREAAVVQRVMVFCHDVTRQVLARHELEEARRRAEDARRTKDEFLAMLSHELRNPLAPIATALELMNLRGGDQLLHERTVIERQLKHLVTLVDDLLDVARIARGKIRLRRELLDMAEIVASSIEMTSPLLEERGHDLIKQVPTGLMVEGDEFRLTQVISNLLSNAAKYTEIGGEICVAAARDGEDVVVRVRDNGIGMSPELTERVFDSFVQGERPSGGQTGLGLGLSLVRNLVGLHGGSVAVHSEGPGRGSEFTVRLPAAMEITAAAAPVVERMHAASTSAEPRRILVVDDNRDAAETLAEVLEAFGYEPCVVFDGPSALKAVESFKPDVALVDIGMPVMDGYEVARRLRELPHGRDIPIIAVSGYGQDQDRARARDSGFDRHFVKPLDFAVLNQSLNELLDEPPPASA